jgi:hypothetical protein
MDIPTTSDFVAGEIVSAEKLNKNSSDQAAFFLNVPKCKLGSTTGQAFSSGVSAVHIFNTENINNDNMHSNTVNPSRMLINTPGLYIVVAQVIWNTNGTGRRVSHIKYTPNGSSSVSVATNSIAGNATYRPSMNLTYQGYLNIGDYLEIECYQDSGVSLSTSTLDGGVTLSAVWVGW